MKHFTELYKQNKVAFYLILVLLALVISLPVFVSKLSSIQKLSSRPRASEPLQEHLCISPEIKGECKTSCVGEDINNLGEGYGCRKGMVCCQKKEILVPEGKIIIAKGEKLKYSYPVSYKEYSLYVVNSTQIREIKLPKLDDDLVVYQYIVSPDGNNIAFSAINENKSKYNVYVGKIIDEKIDNIKLINSFSVEQPKYEDHPFITYFNPIWSPNNTKIMVRYTTEEFGPPNNYIYVYDVNSSKLISKLTMDDGDTFNLPVWLSDSKRILFAPPYETSNIMIYNTEDSTSKKLYVSAVDALLDLDSRIKPIIDSNMFVTNLTNYDRDIISFIDIDYPKNNYELNANDILNVGRYDNFVVSNNGNRIMIEGNIMDLKGNNIKKLTHYNPFGSLTYLWSPSDKWRLMFDSKKYIITELNTNTEETIINFPELVPNYNSDYDYYIKGWYPGN